MHESMTYAAQSKGRIFASRMVVSTHDTYGKSGNAYRNCWFLIHGLTVQL